MRGGHKLAMSMYRGPESAVLIARVTGRSPWAVRCLAREVEARRAKGKSTARAWRQLVTGPLCPRRVG